ncbi:MAG: tryptophan synthase subunit alpha [Endomicrobiia bacterium]
MLEKNLFKTKQVIPYITAGYPALKDTEDVIKFFIDSGIKVLELGIPFSDPVADGPTIQNSSNIALKNGVNIEKIFNLIEKNSFAKSINIIFMTYLNPVIIFGIKKFFKQMALHNIKGIIFPDLIPEEKGIFYPLNKKYKIDTIFLLSSVTEKRRRELIYKSATGFIYLVTITGTTGARKSLPTEFYNFTKTIRQETTKPLCIGFGISCREQVLPIIDYVDGIIIGSAIVEIIGNYNGKERYKKLENFLKQFKF